MYKFKKSLKANGKDEIQKKSCSAMINYSIRIKNEALNIKLNIVNEIH